MIQNKAESNFVERLNRHPQLRERMESLLNVVENADGNCTKSDDAEQYVINELRQMGNEALQSWGKKAALKATESKRKQEPDLQGNGKKK
jgi:hypothetical protein